MKFKINNHTIKYLTAYFSVVSALELLAYGIGGFFEIAAAYIWLFTGFFWLGYFLFRAGSRVMTDIREKKFLCLFGFLFEVILLILFIGNVSFSDINPDATQQVAAGLESFENEALNYTGKAFLGYPNRQYIIAAVPSYIFGRNLWTFQAGFGLLFILGLTVLYLNIRDWLAKRGMKEEYALFPCYALLAFPFITEYYMNFEQAITPVALTMLGLGLMIRFVNDADIIAVLSISYVGGLMADSYTPVLASLGLLIVFIGVYIIRNPKKLQDQNDQPSGNVHTNENTELKIAKPGKDMADTGKFQNIRIACAGCIGTIISFFLASYISGRSDRLTEFRESTSVVKTALDAWKDFFTDANVTFLGVFIVVIALYMLLSFTFRLKLHDFLVSLWVLGVVFFSDYMTGYTTYDKAWVMQRNMIVIPVLAVCIFFAVMEFFGKKKFVIKKPVRIPVLVLLLLGFLAGGLYNFTRPHNSFKYFSYIQPMKYVIQYIEDTLDENGMKPTDEFNLVIYTDNILESNIRDYALYFFPNAVTRSDVGAVLSPEIDYSLPTFIYAEDERLDYLEKETGMEDSRPDYPENMPDTEENDTEENYRNVMSAPTESRTYSNFRYGTDITWYRKCVISR